MQVTAPYHDPLHNASDWWWATGCSPVRRAVMPTMTRGDVLAGDMTGTRRSACPVACALDVVGDRWTLLVIRDLLAGKSRYGDFLASPEKIPTNILADRLKRLEREGLVSRLPYSVRPPRYEY